MQFAKQTYQQYFVVDVENGLNMVEYSVFGDRSPPGFKKVRLLSKLNDTIYWLFKRYSDELENYLYYIIQQIPRNISTFKDKMELIEISTSDLYQRLISQQGMKNLIFDIE